MLKLAIVVAACGLSLGCEFGGPSTAQAREVVEQAWAAEIADGNLIIEKFEKTGEEPSAGRSYVAFAAQFFWPNGRNTHCLQARPDYSCFLKPVLPAGARQQQTGYVAFTKTTNGWSGQLIY